MQMLCHDVNQVPSPGRRPQGAWLRGALLGLALLCNGLALAQEATPLESLLSQVTQWVRVNQRLTDKQFSMAPLDSRVQVLACKQKLQIDQPFANKETLRVRCPLEPGWQLYMRVLLVPGTPAMGGAETVQSVVPHSKTVVMTRQALRRGTVLTQEMLEEVIVASVF